MNNHTESSQAFPGILWIITGLLFLFFSPLIPVLLFHLSILNSPDFSRELFHQVLWQTAFSGPVVFLFGGLLIFILKQVKQLEIEEKGLLNLSYFLLLPVPFLKAIQPYRTSIIPASLSILASLLLIVGLSFLSHIFYITTRHHMKGPGEVWERFVNSGLGLSIIASLLILGGTISSTLELEPVLNPLLSRISFELVFSGTGVLGTLGLILATPVMHVPQGYHAITRLLNGSLIVTGTGLLLRLSTLPIYSVSPEHFFPRLFYAGSGILLLIGSFICSYTVSISSWRKTFKTPAPVITSFRILLSKALAVLFLLLLMLHTSIHSFLDALYMLAPSFDSYFSFDIWVISSLVPFLLLTSFLSLVESGRDRNTISIMLILFAIVSVLAHLVLPSSPFILVADFTGVATASGLLIFILMKNSA